MPPDRIRAVAWGAVERNKRKEQAMMDFDPYENHEQDGRWLGYILLFAGAALLGLAAWLAWGWWG